MELKKYKGELKRGMKVIGFEMYRGEIETIYDGEVVTVHKNGCVSLKTTNNVGESSFLTICRKNSGYLTGWLPERQQRTYFWAASVNGRGYIHLFSDGKIRNWKERMERVLLR